MPVYEKPDNVHIRWKFSQYRSPTGREAITDWRKALQVGPRADFDTFLKAMAKLDEWSPPSITSLKGARFKGLSELRWASGKVQHRVIGRAVEEHHYLMLIGCTHKDRVYSPADALNTAVDRNRKIASGEASTSEYRLLSHS